MKAHYKKVAAAAAVAVVLAVGAAGVAQTTDHAGNSLKRASVAKFGNSL